jgi:hypothetical protein
VTAVYFTSNALPIGSIKMSSPDSDSISGHEKSIVPRAILDDAEIVTAKGNIITKDGQVISTRESDTSLSGNVFADPEIKNYYVGVYEKAKYECRHVFDADLQWSEQEEKRLVRRLDWHGKSSLVFVSSSIYTDFIVQL